MAAGKPVAVTIFQPGGERPARRLVPHSSILGARSGPSLPG
jgi:hypothetical protein